MPTAPTASPLSRWLVPLQRSDDVNLRLVCLPYAGGSAAVFRGWRQRLPDTVEAYAVQLPGRANRLSDVAFTSVSELVLALATALRQHLSRPTVLFGHSMGALVAFELLRELRRRGEPPPVALIVSGCRAAHVPLRTRMHELPDGELIERLRRLGGTPLELLRDRELLDLVLPALRADLRAAETYRYEPGVPLDIPIAAFAGRDDEHARVADVGAWHEHTRAGYSLDLLPGAHFFIHTHCEPFLELLGARLTTWMDDVS